MTGSRKNAKADPAVTKLTEDPIDERTPVQKYLAEIGRKGGLKGGKARAASLSSARRKAIAKKAAKSRWGDDRNS